YDLNNLGDHRRVTPFLPVFPQPNGKSQNGLLSFERRKCCGKGFRPLSLAFPLKTVSLRELDVYPDGKGLRLQGQRDPEILCLVGEDEARGYKRGRAARGANLHHQHLKRAQPQFGSITTPERRTVFTGDAFPFGKMRDHVQSRPWFRLETQSWTQIHHQLTGSKVNGVGEQEPSAAFEILPAIDLVLPGVAEC